MESRVKPQKLFPFAPRRLPLLVAIALAGPAIAVGVPPGANPIPISFERNDGQFPIDVLFVSRGVQGTLALRAGEIAIAGKRASGDPLRLRLAGANPAPEVHPGAATGALSHHYIGTSRIEHVPHYGELQLKDVYPGIDMVLHGRDGALEYDLVVAPGADPNDIRLDLRGAGGVALDRQGNLQIMRGGETLTQHAPVAYQGEGAYRRGVEARFELLEGAEGPEARIVLGAYDAAASLTVDPVIGYSTYVGSSGGDAGAVARLDNSGDVYYAMLGGSGSVDAIVITRLDPRSNAIRYQTSFGGHGFNVATDLQLGGPGNRTAYVSGTTRAIDFPVAPPKTNPSSDAFVAVLAADGTLAHTRLIGGSASDAGVALALDKNGFVYLAGNTNSQDLGATTGPALNLGASGGGFPASVASDGFVAKLDPAMLATVYLRYVGGSGSDSLAGIAVDDAGRAVVAGANVFGGVPQVNAGAPTSPPPLTAGESRGFVAKLSADGASYVYSQYVGGRSFTADAVAFDPTTGDAVVAGTTFTNTLVPAPAAPFHGGFDVFLVRVNDAGTPTYATYLGGSGNDLPEAVAVDRQGLVYVTGATRSLDFPTVNPLPGHGGSRNGATDAFVTRYNAGTIDFSTYLGGSGDDNGTSLDVSNKGEVWVGGFTQSIDYPTVTPWRATRFGPSDGFITQIDGLPRGRGRP